MSTDTRENLLEIATAQVGRQGYSGFSYADLATQARIRKPSIHHHFPTKESLGVAMVKAYTERFSERLNDIEVRQHTAAERLRAYGRLYREALVEGRGCLCGVLASERAVLPGSVQVAVQQFFRLQLRWIERVLRGGALDGSLRKDLEPRRDARAVLAALQGAIVVALALQEPASFDQALTGLIGGLGPRPA